MKLVSLLFKHVVGNQASIAAYPIPAASPERHGHRVLKWVLRRHLLGNKIQLSQVWSYLCFIFGKGQLYIKDKSTL